MCFRTNPLKILRDDCMCFIIALKLWTFEFPSPTLALFLSSWCLLLTLTFSFCFLPLLLHIFSPLPPACSFIAASVSSLVERGQT